MAVTVSPYMEKECQGTDKAAQEDTFEETLLPGPLVLSTSLLLLRVL